MDLSDMVNAEAECALCLVRSCLRTYVFFGSGADEYDLGHRFEGPTLNQVLEVVTNCRQCGGELLVDIDIVDNVITGVRARPAPLGDGTDCFT